MDDLFLTEKAQLCKSKEKQYKRMRRAVARDERFLEYLAKCIKEANVPPGCIPGFTKLYQDAFARISMVERNGKKEIFNGKVVHSKTKVYTGPNLGRLIKYLSEECPQESTIGDTLKELRPVVKVDKQFTDGVFELYDYINCHETLYLRDITTINLLKIKELKKAYPQKEVAALVSTLANDPWLRATRSTHKLIWMVMIHQLAELWESKLGIKLKKLYFGDRLKEGYYKFQLDNCEKWHTAETEAEAKLVAKAMKSEITTLVYVDPNASKTFEIVDSRGNPIPASLEEDGCWLTGEAGTEKIVKIKQMVDNIKNTDTTKSSGFGIFKK